MNSRPNVPVCFRKVACGFAALLTQVAIAQDTTSNSSAAAASTSVGWAQWRGPTGDGVVPVQEVAPGWDQKTNVKWRMPLAQPGNGSPIVAAGRVFVTMREDDEGKGRSLYCFDRESGRKLWVATVTIDRAMPTHETNPHCSTTPASDGRRVVVWHASAGMCCYDLEGKQLWRRDLGEFRHQWGHGTSPVLYGDNVILNSGPGEHSFVASFRLVDGTTAWRTDEPSLLTAEQIAKKRLAGSWCTPLLHRVGDRDLVLCGQPTRVVAYDAKDGSIVWWCDGISSKNGDLTYSSPTVAGDVCVIQGGYQGPSIGVRMDGSGNVTESHRVWRRDDVMSNCASGVFAGGAVFLPEMGGFVQCIDPKSGATKWRARVGRGNSWGSILKLGGRLYMMNQAGATHVFEPNSERLVMLASNELNEKTNSTPAISDGEIFLRTHEHLYCIARPPVEAK